MKDVTRCQSDISPWVCADRGCAECRAWCTLESRLYRLEQQVERLRAACDLHPTDAAQHLASFKAFVSRLLQEVTQ